MTRRELITCLGGAAAVWPLAADSQQRSGVRRIGALVPRGPVSPIYVRSLQEGLETLGWVDGKNIHVEYRWALGDVDATRAEAAKLLALTPEVIVSGGTQATTVLKEATRIIPIVFVHVADPLSGGVVQSLVQPGDNITGFASYEASIGAKWLELLKDIAPHVRHVLVLIGQNPTWRMHVPAIEIAASSLKVQLTKAHVGNAAEIKPAIEAFARKHDGGMIVLPDYMLDDERERIVALSVKHRIPDVYAGSEITSGGLLFYSSDWPDLYRRAASYVDQILKGAKPGDLPVQQPIKFRMVINLNTAKNLGLTVSPSLLARADEVIE